MKTPCSPLVTRFRSRESGSTLIVGMMTLAVLALIAAATFETVTKRFRSNYQMASWHDALTSAESGVQYSLARLRSPLTTSGVLTNPLNVPGSLQSDLATLTGNGGTSTNGTVLSGTYNGSTFPRIQLPTLTIPHTGLGSSIFSAVTTVDAVPAANITSSGTNTWYRVQSIGTVPLSGGRGNVGMQKYDNFLRKLQFRYDSSGNALTNPQAVRTIEVIVRPITTGSAALFGATGINLNNQNVVIDSYDSRSSATSTNGLYDATKRTQAANIVTDDDPLNGTPGVINLSPTGAYVYGNISTNSTPVSGSTGHVSGTVTEDFYQTLPNPPNPASVSSTWATPTSSMLNGNTSIPTGTQASPTYYEINSDLSLTGNSSITFQAPAVGAPDAYVQVWITGQLKTTGNGQITIPSNVHVTFYIDGAIQVAGNGIVNNSQLPTNVTVYGNDMDPSNPNYVQQTMTFNGNASFAGVIYAPNAAVTVKGGGSNGDTRAIYANTIFFNGQTSLHYDQALADQGAVIDYRIASWYEDNTLTR